MTNKLRLLPVVFLCFLFTLTTSIVAARGNQYAIIKEAFFNDPNTYYQYRVAAFNTTLMTTGSTYRSGIRVSRVKLDEKTLKPTGRSEVIQTINYHPSLVDFDLNCQQKHCYLVTISSRSKQNLRLYGWRRTQFDELADRDTFARPHSVRIFRIRSDFYVAVAQDQLHLASVKLSLEEPLEEPRFVGCAILKFKRGNERNIRYHQFIKLPFNPLYAHHFVSDNSYVEETPKSSIPIRSHFLVFSTRSNWTEPSSGQAYSFIWSALDNYFWPYRLPKTIKIEQTIPGSLHRVISIPKELPPVNLSRTQPNIHYEPVESCFHQLQSELARREDRSQRLIEYGRTLWQSSLSQSHRYHDSTPMTKVAARVYVHGNVTVKGPFLNAPQLSLVGYQQQNVTSVVGLHSPMNVDNILAQASIKLRMIRAKISKAVYIDTPSTFKSYIRFFGLLSAGRVSFDPVADISNSDVRINGIPFNQLQHELVSLKGSQTIPSKVVFSGNVVADLLEIHGVVNAKYLIKDAVDITSSKVQVIDLLNARAKMPYQTTGTLEFYSVESPELNMDQNSTINGILIDDIITRDGRTQVIVGNKWITQLSMSKLSLASPDISLNAFNISQIASNTIRLRGARYQQLFGKNSFSRPVTANKLFIHNNINRYINVTSLIHDSIKSADSRPQYVFGHKRFLSGLTMNNLDAHGSINGINPKKVFNVNPISNMNDPELNRLEGNYKFDTPVECLGNLNVRTLNEVDIFSRAIRRGTNFGVRSVRGRKIFRKPVTVINNVRLFAPNNLTIPYPLINNIDVRVIKRGLDKQMQSPRKVYIDHLVVRGNLDLDLTNGSHLRSTLGAHNFCPLGAIRSRFILESGEDQLITNPMRIDSLRASSVYIDPSGLNGASLPGDFVLRSNPYGVVEPIYGTKTFAELVMTTPYKSRTSPHRYVAPGYQPPWSSSFGVTFGHNSSINSVTQADLHAFVTYERQRNSTGEKLLQTLHVHGDIWVNRINGYLWPDDILLKSMASRLGSVSTPYMHKRIYSPLIFMEPHSLQVDNQLVLRGPIHLRGRLNGVNLTDFTHQSVTYGDKDLLSGGRAIRNKYFAGGLTVRNELKAQGLIDGVNIEDMKRRVITTRPTGKELQVLAPKMFMSDVNFLSPIHMNYLNEVPIDNFLRRIKIGPDNVIRLSGKKTISGALRINKILEVQGLINGKDFLNITAHAIPLNSGEHLVFNKTLTVEGDVFMDNLIINEKDGIIDGVKLVDLLPVDPSSKNEIVLSNPKFVYDPVNHHMTVDSIIQECQVSCSLVEQPLLSRASPSRILSQTNGYSMSRPIQFNRTAVSHKSSTAPYATIYPVQEPRLHRRSALTAANQHGFKHPLISRKPIGIQYELAPSMKKHSHSNKNPLISNQLEHLRYHIVALNLIRPSSLNKYVMGFIDSDSNNVATHRLKEEDALHTDHPFNMPSFLQLDQIDFPFRPTTYHMSVGVLTGQTGINTTSVYSSIGGGPPRQLSTLPVGYPNSAMFFKLPQQNGLALIISEDYSVSDRYGSKCPVHIELTHFVSRCDMYSSQPQQDQGGIHVYMFHALFNSSNLQQAYFDLYQTIDIPAIDSFEHFEYNDAAYVLAVSRAFNRIYLLLLRGYSGFQVVSHIDAPLLDRVKVVESSEGAPAIIVYQTDGLHRLMESVVI